MWEMGAGDEEEHGLTLYNFLLYKHRSFLAAEGRLDRNAGGESTWIYTVYTYICLSPHRISL